MGDERNIQKVLVGKPEGLRPLGNLRHEWVDNVKVDLGWHGVIWTGLIWVRLGTGRWLLLTC
jgi:hypothetical protein